MASLGEDSLPPTSSLVAAAFGSLVSTQVYTGQEYQAMLKKDSDLSESAQRLDMAQMYEHTLVWGQLGEKGKSSGSRYIKLIYTCMIVNPSNKYNINRI